MNRHVVKEQRFCPQCGAPIGDFDSSCWMCRAALPADAEILPDDGPVARVTASGIRSAPRAVDDGGSKFTLNSLMLVITLICVCLGMAASAPGLAIPLVVVVTPALVRTFAVGRRRRAAGDEFTTNDKIVQFAMSTGLMIVVAISASFAFLMACTAACFVVGIGTQFQGKFDIGLVIGIAAIAALIVFVGLTVAFWPRTRSKERTRP